LVERQDGRNRIAIGGWSDCALLGIIRMIKICGRQTSIHTQRVLWALADVDLSYELTLASATMGSGGP